MKDTSPADPPLQHVALTSPDLNAKRLVQLKHLMPDLFTDEGNLDEAALRQLVDHAAVTQGPSHERYRFDWAGKAYARHFALEPTQNTLTFDPNRSINPQDTQNIIIEGENLETLKILSRAYFKQIKCIYIDPPYNTGNDFIYLDKWSESKEAYWYQTGVVVDGIKFDALTDADGRKHSKWLSMIYARLLLAHRLLRDDGVIFVSIDDNEVHNLRKVMDEVFGEDNFICNFLWKKKSTTSNVKDAQVSPQVDYQLCYGKSQGSRIKQRVKSVDERSYPNKDAEGNYRTSVIEKKDSGAYRRDTMKYAIMGHYPRDGKRWQIGQQTAAALEEKNRLIWDGEKILLKTYDFEDNNSFSAQPNLLDDHGTSDGASKLANNELFKTSELFDNPKPIELLAHLLNITTSENDIVMDFFAGSGTTAHAVMALNATDDGNRRFILVQAPEYTDDKSEAHKAGYNTIADICIERVKRAGAKIVQEVL